MDAEGLQRRSEMNLLNGEAPGWRAQRLDRSDHHCSGPNSGSPESFPGGGPGGGCVVPSPGRVPDTPHAGGAERRQRWEEKGGVLHARGPADENQPANVPVVRYDHASRDNSGQPPPVRRRLQVELAAEDPERGRTLHEDTALPERHCLLAELRHAAEQGDCESMHQLIDRGAPLHGTIEVITDERTGQKTLTTVLHVAISHNRHESVQLLLERNADPTLSDSFGGTPLMSAAFWGNRRTMLTLLEYKACVDDVGPTARIRVNFTAFELACIAGRSECAVELVARGSDDRIGPDDRLGPDHPPRNLWFRGWTGTQFALHARDRPVLHGLWATPAAEQQAQVLLPEEHNHEFGEPLEAVPMSESDDESSAVADRDCRRDQIKRIAKNDRQLTKLDWREDSFGDSISPVTDLELFQLAAALPGNTYLSSVYLDGCRSITVGGLLLLTAAIPQCAVLCVSIEGSAADTRWAKKDAGRSIMTNIHRALIADEPEFTSLNMGSLLVRDRHLREIAERLSGNRNLAAIRFRFDFRATEVGLSHIVRALSNCSVAQVGFDGGETTAGWQPIMMSTARSPDDGMLEDDTHSIARTILSMEMRAAMQAILAPRAIGFLKSNSTSPSLHLIRTNQIWTLSFGDQEAKQLADALENNTKAQHVEICDSEQLTADGVEQLKRAVGSGSSGVMSLQFAEGDPSSNLNPLLAFHRAEIEQLCFANTIQRLRANDPDTTSIYLGRHALTLTDGSLRLAALQEISMALRQNKVLRSVSIAHDTPMTDAGIEMIVLAMPQCGVESVEYCHERCSDEVGKRIFCDASLY
jgi:hypothetical protein